jgi:hypothetical protein
LHLKQGVKGLAVVDDERYQRAKERVDRLKGFYWNLAMFGLVNLLLFAIDAFTGDGWWFYWVTIFWGFGVIVQGFTLFGPFTSMSRGWEDRKIRQYMEEDK